LSRWRTAHIHVRRPSGVLLSMRVRGFAALDELRGFRPKQKRHGLSVGAAQAATAPLRLRRRLRCMRNVAVAACDRRKSSRTPLLQRLRCRYANGALCKRAMAMTSPTCLGNSNFDDQFDSIAIQKRTPA
ncbi:hypothetical protein, partial [Lysobacter sp. Root690]|uniref:hypothetical protein n=1 Tax=Lysobacter sp. Root690 TaxID=1736588 RepID=UPI001F1FE8A0